MENTKKQPLSLKEIQNTELQILLYVDAFCREHNIQYSLYAGTMLGAIRHKGFIPWDDDVDICMTRENYEKFLSEFKGNDRYVMENNRINPKFKRLFFTKIFDTYTVATEDGFKPLPNGGLWVDIFPMDYVPDDSKKRKKIIKKLYIDSKLPPYRDMTKPTGKALLARALFFWKGTKKMTSEFENYVATATKGKYCKDLTSQTLESIKKDTKLYPTDCFNHYVDVLFEGHLLPCLADYKDVLTIEFGDYMTLPPVEKRQTHHITAYFKE